jgi:hypothetical protein
MQGQGIPTRPSPHAAFTLYVNAFFDHIGNLMFARVHPKRVPYKRQPFDPKTNRRQQLGSLHVEFYSILYRLPTIRIRKHGDAALAES